MKRILTGVFAVLCCLSLFLFAAAPRAGAVAVETIHLEDLIDLNEDTVFTMEQLLTLLQEAYDLGYEDGKKAASTFTPATGFRLPTAATVTPAARSSPLITYVLNTNSMKFHYPSCSSAAAIAEGNRLDFSGTREDVLAMGYSPCGRCNP